MNTKVLLYFTAIIVLTIGVNCSTDEKGKPANPIDPGDTLTNHPPVIRMQPDTAATVGETLILFAFAEDEDGDSIIYGMSNIRHPYIQPNKALTDFDEVTVEFHFYVRISYILFQMFEFYAMDRECNSDTTFFIVHVR